jgi:hypothetical protein
MFFGLKYVNTPSCGASPIIAVDRLFEKIGHGEPNPSILAIAFPLPPPFQYTVFRVVLAVAAAGFISMTPGFIQVTISNWLRAGGAIGVFVVVYFFSPVALVANP